MADEHDRPVLRRDGAAGRRHVGGERGRRVLHDGDVVAVALQDVVDAPPARAVDEAAVHQDDVPDLARRFRTGGWDQRSRSEGRPGREQRSERPHRSISFQGRAREIPRRMPNAATATPRRIAGRTRAILNDPAERRRRQDPRSVRLKAPGLKPTTRRNTRPKWLWSAKPQASAISDSAPAERDSIVLARSTRRACSH